MPGRGWGSFIGQAAGIAQNPAVQRTAQSAVNNLSNEGVRNTAQTALNYMTSPGAQRAATFAQSAARGQVNVNVGNTPVTIGTSRMASGGGRSARSTWMQGSMLDNKGTPWWQASQFKVGQPQAGGTDWRQMNDLSVKRIPANGRRMNFRLGLPNETPAAASEMPQGPQSLAAAPSPPGTSMTPTGDAWNTTNVGEATMKPESGAPYGSLAGQYPDAIDVSARDRIGEFGSGMDAGRGIDPGRMQELEAGPPRTVRGVGRKPRGRGSRKVNPEQEILPGFENV